MIRWFFFLLTIAIGAAAGLYYGWVVNPIRYVDAAPAVLRADYKADYVLMTAEAYRADGDMDLALERLALLGGASPAESVALATVFAVKAGYGEADLALMQSLADAIHAADPPQERSWSPPAHEGRARPLVSPDRAADRCSAGPRLCLVLCPRPLRRRLPRFIK
jgi:hypothetical protein